MMIFLYGCESCALLKRTHGKEKGARVSCAFWEPDTRRQPLPLLPFGSGGVGGATAARFPENSEGGAAGGRPAGLFFYPHAGGPVNAADRYVPRPGEKEFSAFILMAGNVRYFAMILQELHSVFTLPGYKGIRERKHMETGFRLAAWSGRGGQMIRVVNLNKSFSGVRALGNVSFRVRPGEMVAITGRHGAGKSVLLRQLCGFSAGDREEGYVMVGGASVQKNGLVNRDIRDIRAGMGIVFPDRVFAERVSVARNAVSGALAGSCRLDGTDGRLDDENVCRAMDALARMGLRDKAWQSTASLSCVQRWKLALARTLVQGAQVLFAEDPALNAEPRSVCEIMELLSEFNAREGVTVVVALADWTYARYCSRAIVLDRGSIVYDGRVRSMPSGYSDLSDLPGFGGIAA